MARKVPKAEELKGWYTPDQARRLAYPPLTWEGATNAIWSLVTGDLVRVAATQSSTRTETGNVIADRTPAILGGNIFAQLSIHQVEHFWDGRIELFHGRGNAALLAFGRRPIDNPKVTYFGLKLDPADLHEHYPPQTEAVTAPPSKPAASPNPGGRKPAWWREPVLIELAGQLHDLTLQPNILADLERAAMDWLSKQGESPGERTVRMVVTPLWARISKGGKNRTG